MARASTTSDAFNAIAEGARREVLEALADGEVEVNDLVAQLGFTQPQVSKHLAVLRAVDLVTVRADGRQRLYSLNTDTLCVLYEWIKPFERLWNATKVVPVAESVGARQRLRAAVKGSK